MEDEIYEIIARVIAGEPVSAGERQRLDAWRGEHEENENEYQVLVRLREPVRLARKQGGINWKVAFKRVESRCERKRKMKIYRIASICAVASVLLVVGSTLLWKEVSRGKEYVVRPFIPGNNQVLLTLRHGKVIPLEKETTEVVLADSAFCVTNEGEALVYSATGKSGMGKSVTGEKRGETFYNTLTIPVGGEYRVVLSDGTKVHLNSGTEFRYPEVFQGRRREVFLKGEAWFEVAGDSLCPFVVHAGEMNIQVLGTSFNVRAYERLGSQTTTLVTGRVEVKCNDESFRILPGEQFEYFKDGKRANVKKVDTELYTSWKNGYYKFQQATLEEIMTTLSMWYGLDVFYQDEKAKHLEFTGDMKKYGDVDNLFRQFEQTGNVLFSRKGNTVIIQLK